MHYAHLVELIRQAAMTIEQAAQSQRYDHLSDQKNSINYDTDTEELTTYERNMQLASELRLALEEFNIYHKTAIGLEQMLREHRENRIEISYQDLVSLLPEIST